MGGLCGSSSVGRARVCGAKGQEFNSLFSHVIKTIFTIRYGCLVSSKTYGLVPL